MKNKKVINKLLIMAKKRNLKSRTTLAALYLAFSITTAWLKV
jgi:hypothetical protein